MKPLKNSLWMHDANGDHYTLLMRGQMRVAENTWVDSVTYVSWENGEIYTRDLDSFLANFTHVTKPREK